MSNCIFLFVWWTLNHCCEFVSPVVYWYLRIYMALPYDFVCLGIFKRKQKCLDIITLESHSPFEDSWHCTCCTEISSCLCRIMCTYKSIIQQSLEMHWDLVASGQWPGAEFSNIFKSISSWLKSFTEVLYEDFSPDYLDNILEKCARSIISSWGSFYQKKSFFQVQKWIEVH